jgi:hypothetical protein
MASGFLETNGKMAWGKEPGRVGLGGVTIGKKVITLIQSYGAWRCASCELLLFDYGHAI